MLHARRRDPGGGLAAARGRPLRLPRRRRLQVADLAARDGVDDRRTRAARRDRCRRRRAGSPATTRTRRTSGRRCGWPTTRGGSTPPPPGSPTSARCPRWSCSTRSASRRSTSTTSRVANHFRARDGARAEQLRDRVDRRCPADSSALRAAGIQAAHARRQAARRLPPLQRRRGRRPGGRRPPKSSPGNRLEGVRPPEASACRSPRRRRAPQPARARCAAASRASSAGTSCGRRAASSWPGAGSPGPAWRR